MSQSNSDVYFEDFQDTNNYVVFLYFPFNEQNLVPVKIKLYKDTMYISKLLRIFDTLQEKTYIDFRFCKKIGNRDTLKIINDFVCLFIVEKTESIIIKGSAQMMETDYDIILIQEYNSTGQLLFKEDVIMYPEREYNPKFLQLYNLFFNIAKQNE
jgi:hypothetical protein